MKVIMAAVISADGFITRGEEGVSKWASSEDQAHFAGLVEQADVIVIGRNTFTEAGEDIARRPGRFRLVMTRHPAQYDDQAVPGKMAFTDESPAEIVQRYRDEGIGTLLIAGGGTIYAAFVNAGVVDELILTIEPRLFGQGTPFLGGIAANARMELVNVEQANEQGTLFLTYHFAADKG